MTRVATFPPMIYFFFLLARFHLELELCGDFFY